MTMFENINTKEVRPSEAFKSEPLERKVAELESQGFKVANFTEDMGLRLLYNQNRKAVLVDMVGREMQRYILTERQFKSYEQK